VNEATLLYVTALETLGERPAEIGSCGQTADTTRTYARIAPLIGKGSEFLLELETYTLVRTGPTQPPPKIVPRHAYTIPKVQLKHHVNQAVALHAVPARFQSHVSAVSKTAAVAHVAATAAHSIAPPPAAPHPAATHAATSAPHAGASAPHATVSHPAPA